MFAVIDSRSDRPGLVHMRAAIAQHCGRIAVVSSFGAESAVLLALVAEIDPMVPVIFLQTGKHFAETLEYKARLVAHLGLRDVRDIRPDAAELARRDPEGTLYRSIPDDCCTIRKVAPLARAMVPFAAWINGRKRHHGITRAALPFVERDEDGRLKLNPLADWSAAEIIAEMTRRDLPRHALTALGYTSIGCAPCTRARAPGEDARGGRWAGSTKIECGIHRPANAADASGLVLR